MKNDSSDSAFQDQLDAAIAESVSALIATGAALNWAFFQTTGPLSPANRIIGRIRAADLNGRSLHCPHLRLGPRPIFCAAWEHPVTLRCAICVAGHVTPEVEAEANRSIDCDACGTIDPDHRTWAISFAVGAINIAAGLCDHCHSLALPGIG